MMNTSEGEISAIPDRHAVSNLINENVETSRSKHWTHAWSKERIVSAAPSTELARWLMAVDVPVGPRSTELFGRRVKKIPMLNLSCPSVRPSSWLAASSQFVFYILFSFLLVRYILYLTELLSISRLACEYKLSLIKFTCGEFLQRKVTRHTIASLYHKSICFVRINF